MLALGVAMFPGAILLADQLRDCDWTWGDFVNDGQLTCPPGWDRRGQVGLGCLVLLAGVVAYLVIQLRMTGRGQSIGMRLVRIHVLDAGTLQPIGTKRAVVRMLGQLPTTWVFGVNYLWLIWDDRKQAWHDKMVGAAVYRQIPRRSSEPTMGR